MKSILSITTAASDLALLSEEELRIAAGLSDDDGSRDTELAALGLEAAEWIASPDVCNVTGADRNVPTLLEEQLSETFRLGYHDYTSSSDLTLARIFISAVTVTENDEVLIEDTDFEVLSEGGQLRRLSDARPICWPCGTIVAAYTAGFVTAPSLVKGVAIDFVRMRLSQRGTRDPLLRSVTAEGIGSRSYWDGGAVGAEFTDEACRRLSRYVNYPLG